MQTVSLAPLWGHRQFRLRDLFELKTSFHNSSEKRLHSILVTPVVYEERWELQLFKAVYSHRFNDDESCARALADLGAIAIQNARLSL